jgi:hypothetical protein
MRGGGATKYTSPLLVSQVLIIMKMLRSPMHRITRNRLVVVVLPYPVGRVTHFPVYLQLILWPFFRGDQHCNPIRLRNYLQLQCKPNVFSRIEILGYTLLIKLARRMDF